MNIRQTILKAFYPVVMHLSKSGNKGSVLVNKQQTPPLQPFYALTAHLNNGDELPFADLKGKKILLVNTASNCGYTGQYAELQKLYEQNQDKLAIIGFPANDFKEQEKGDDQEIAQFCQINYGVTFPIAKKSKVVKGPGQVNIFHWLTDATQNGWNNHTPDWNFSKYLIDENGVLTHYFGSAISPQGEEISKAVNV